MSTYKRSGVIDHIKSIIALPLMVLIVIPYLIYRLSPNWGLSHFIGLPEEILFGIGILLGLLSGAFFISTLILFIRISQGTLAPWAPSTKLVVRGYYRHTRNPMILAVLIILLAQAFFFNSFFLMLWCLLFLIINHFYFLKIEEPGLVNRFGVEYLQYKKHVPRWLPRRRGWRPEDERMITDNQPS